MNKSLKNDLAKVFDTPKPERKQEFLNKTIYSYPKVSKTGFILTQMGYIRKSFWILSILILVGIIFTAEFNANKNMAILIFSASLPLLTLVGIIEINKSITFDMAELELSCKYNLSEVSLIRLAIIGSFHVLILMVSLIFAVRISTYELLQTGLYIITPFLLSTYLTLYITNRLQSRDTIYICGVVTIGISLATIILTVLQKDIYAQNNVILWGLVLVVTMVLITKEIIKIIKRMEELSWNSPLTA